MPLAGIETGGQTNAMSPGGQAGTASPFTIGGGVAAGEDLAGNPGAGGMNPGAAGEPSAGAVGAASGEDLDLVDDMEARFPNLPLRDGRDGAWFAAHDNTADNVVGPSAATLMPPRGSSRVAAGISGAGFTDWGAQLGLWLRASPKSYDASGYCGLHFWAKGSGAGWTFLVSDRSSMPQGGVCDAVNLKSAAGCYHFVGKGFSVSQDWQELTLGFNQLRLVADPTSPRRLETNAIYTIMFNFHNDAGSAFRLIVDDISFVRAGSDMCPLGSP